MDSFTHIVLGATLGEAVAGSRLKKKAMLLGAIAQSIPDIDILASLWTDPAADLLAHRGFTHSILFALLLSAVLAWLARRWLEPEDFSYRSWFGFFALQILLHIFLDTFNAYGTGWLEPFSHRRFSFNVLYVADPLFTIWLILSTLALLSRWNNAGWRTGWTRFGLLLAGLYLVLAISFKLIIAHDVKTSLEAKGIITESFFTTPTPFNSLLHFIVAKDKNGFQTGYRSVFDQQKMVNTHYIPAGDSLLIPLGDRHDVQDLERFSRGFRVVYSDHDTLTFSDLRFGQLGVSDNGNPFVFRYYLQYPDQNRMVIQRGRFSRFNTKSMADLWNRIRGN